MEAIFQSDETAQLMADGSHSYMFRQKDKHIGNRPMILTFYLFTWSFYSQQKHFIIRVLHLPDLSQ